MPRTFWSICLTDILQTKARKGGARVLLVAAVLLSLGRGGAGRGLLE
jgi:hypothetical protein